MVIEVPTELETALKTEAATLGVPTEIYIQFVLKQASGLGDARKPLISGLGMWKEYGFNLSEEEIDENRRDMLKNSVFAEDF